MSDYADIEDLKQVPIEEVLDELDYDYNFNPRGFKIEAHWHPENTPSCHIYPDSNSFYHYATGDGGSVIDFVMVHFGCNLVHALRWLQGLDVDVDAPIRESKPEVHSDFHGTVFFEGEPITAFTVETMCEKWPALAANKALVQHELGLFEAPNALWVPHRGSHAHDWMPGVKVRSLTDWSKTAFKGSQFTHSLYWPYNKVPDPAEIDELWLVEGESDAWCMRANRTNWTVAGLPAGGSTWRDAWLEGMVNLQFVHTWFDPDHAGDIARANVDKVANDWNVAWNGFSVKHWTDGRVAESLAEQLGSA